MADLYEKVTAQEDVFKKLVSKIPGFDGYVERVNRRSADKLLRETIAARFQGLWQRISESNATWKMPEDLRLLDRCGAGRINCRQFM